MSLYNYIMKHTCITDDGGTPNRKCAACAAEEQEKKVTNNTIQTYTGKFFDVFNPDPDLIDIEDIAHALSLHCRFTGHTKVLWSVGQHSLLVCNLCTGSNKLWGLLHDASEAYLTDVARPIKYHPDFKLYREVEHYLQTAIFEKFGLTGPMPAEVKWADDAALKAEADRYMHGTERWDDLDAPAVKVPELWLQQMPPERTEWCFKTQFWSLIK